MTTPPAPSTASVVIPAHNEEKVIGACLARMFDGAADGELDVVVVANGCDDRTAEIARSIHPDVRVLELAVGSKPLALNLGDETAVGFPRFYVDADIQLGIDAIRQVVAVLRSGEALSAAPRMRLDLEGRPWRVRAFYDIWTQLHYVTNNHVGSGVCALSEAARSRFDRFPDIVADDLFLLNLCEPDERASVADCEFVDRTPFTLRDLVRIKGRSAAGNWEYAARYKEAARRSRELNGPRGSGASVLLRRPTEWPALAIYTGVYVAAQARGWWKFRFGDLSHWDRDESARDVATQR
jgi:glycosyltransferase involved in cell wall biosynthesis